jgi:hypothetical protein
LVPFVSKTHESMVLMKELAKNCGFWEGSFVIFYFFRMLVTYQNQLAYLLRTKVMRLKNHHITGRSLGPFLIPHMVLISVEWVPSWQGIWTSTGLDTKELIILV